LNNKISNSHIEALREQFKKYLNNNYGHLKDKGVIYSDAFYPYRYDIGMDFWDVFIDESSLRKARELLEIRFTNKQTHKNPKRNSYEYVHAFKIFKEFIDNTYGSVGGNIDFAKTNQPPKIEKVATNNSLKKTQKKKATRSDVPSPCCDEVAKYLLAWEQLEKYSLQESALNKLFYRTYPDNKDIDDVLVKVSVLNDFYSTNIFSPFQVAKHIIDLDIDERLASSDVTLVDEIARVDMGNGKVKNFYSFATKYCSHHKPLDFPIYDGYVDTLLCYFRDVDEFYSFSKHDLRDYVKFKKIFWEFRKFYNLESYNPKDIDKYLWQLGKEKFPKKY
jgi:hypothetical protein